MARNIIQRSNDPVLDRIVTGYTPQGFIREMVLPKISVKARKGDILASGKDFLRIQNDVQLGRGNTPEITYDVSVTDGWNVENHALKAIVTKEDGANWNTENAKAGMTQAKNSFGKIVKQALMLGAENALATTVTDAANYAAGNKVTLSGTSQWSDYTGTSDPIGVSQQAQTATYDATGYVPNVCVLSFEVWNYLRNHPEIIARFSSHSAKFSGATQQQVALALGVEKIAIGHVKKNTATKGQTATLASVWPKSALFIYVNPNPNPDIFEDSFGNSFEFEAMVSDSEKLVDPKGAEFVRVTSSYDDVVRDFGAGYLVSDAVA